MRFILLALMSTAIFSGACAQSSNSIGYPTVGAALAALRARTDLDITVQGAWTIVTDVGAKTIWSFAPPGHAAYPTAVKRVVVEREGRVVVEMSALCEARKLACDGVMAEFKAMQEGLASDAAGNNGRAQAAAASSVEVQRTGDDAYLLVLRSHRSKTPDEGQQELLPKADEVCGTRGVRYGKFAFETSAPVDAQNGPEALLLLRQNIVCGAVARAPDAPAADPTWTPSAAQLARVERRSRDYFVAKDSGRYTDAYAMFSPLLQKTTELAGWQSNAEQFLAKSGAARGRTITNITWYKNPAGVEAGTYAAVDFSARFERVTIYCGYIALHEQADGAFKIAREDDRFIDQESAGKMSADQLAAAQAKIGCR